MAKKTIKKKTAKPVKRQARTLRLALPKKKTTAPAKKSTSVALSVRNSRGSQVQARAVDLNIDRVIGVGEVALGSVGLMEVKLTDKEEETLNEAVREEDVVLRPGKRGPAIPYLPHIVYTRWLNRAFGRTGWGIVPVSQPALKGKSVIIQFVLSIHGVPVATAAGEQDYFEDNPQQSYGDVVESCVGSGLRRCCKRLGIGLEMWDKAFCKRMVETRQHTLPAEHQRSSGESGTKSAPTTKTGYEGSAISEGQARRLFAICKTAQRKQGEVRRYLQAIYGIVGKDLDSAFAGITRKDYDQICAAIEKRGPLPEKETSPRPPAEPTRQEPGREPDEVLPAITDDDISWNMR